MADMLLKKFMLKDPRNESFTEVYEYPECLASPTLKRSDCVLVSKVPMQIPIIVAPKAYLKEFHNEGLLMDMLYGDLTYLNLYFEDEKARSEQHDFDDKVNQVKEIFSMGTFHKRSCQTFFFTGPKAVYKQKFSDVWVWLEQGVLSLANRGHFRTIESLSLKGINEVFITGTFECGEEVLPNTQCKITVSQT